MPQSFQVERDNLSHTRTIDAPALTPAKGEAVLQVERFALTANNITYGVAGDMIGYWNFFPAEDGWGQIPVWGIASVSASEHPDLNPGDRYYGYFPMANELLVKPERVSARGFTDAAAHRSALPVVYNQYSMMSEDNGFTAGFDNHAMLYRPLFTTSFVLDDFLADNGFFGADHVILASASSKTAFGLAYMLKHRDGVSVSGLTSAGNMAFVSSMDLYDAVYSYEDLDSLPQQASVLVDMAGNAQVREKVHHLLGDTLRYSCGVGMTHWDSPAAAPADLPGPKPEMFFAPTQIVKRNEELGPAVYQAQLREATDAFCRDVDKWVNIEEHPFTDMQAVYELVLNSAPPQRGIVVTL